MQVAIVGIELFEELLSETEKMFPEWLSWCKLIELVHKLLQPSMKREEVLEAMQLNCQYQKLYDEVCASLYCLVTSLVVALN